jgi:uncharacterized protein (UPF0335 family)
MDKATAWDFVKRIEAHRKAEERIWQEMRNHGDYEPNEDVTIRDILDARKKGNALMAEADAQLDAFDWVEDANGDFVPRSA